MADDQSIDRSISIKGNAVNSVITSGDGNSVVVYQSITATAPLASGANPYLGLLAFTENEADRFFGREVLVADLWGRYQRLATAPPQPDAARFLTILGPSGSGKSSLARAGLVAELARRPVGPRGQRVAVLTPGADPLRSLAVVLARIATDDPAPLAKADEFRQALTETRDGAHDGLSRIATALPGAGAPLLVLVDQFEEIYSHAGETAAGPGAGDRKAFIETLLHAASVRAGDVSVVVTLRSDFLGATQTDSQLNRAIASQNLIVPAMSEDELRRAIAQPAINAGSPIDEAVISRLVQDTVGLDGALPLLQFVLVQIWEGMCQGQTAAAVFDKVGGVGGALGRTAEDTFSHLAPDEQVIAQHVFLGMVAFNDDQRPTRRRAPLRQLVADQQDKSSDVEWAETRRVIDAFADPTRRVITLSSNSAGEETVEVTHEAIFDHWDRLEAWLADGMDDIRLHARLADAAELWDKAQRPEGYLWRPPDLDLLRDLAAKPGAGLSQCEAEFFHASRDAYDKEMAERRRVHAWTQIAAIALAVLAVLAIGASVVANFQSRDAAVQGSNALAGASRQALEAGDGGRALLLALAAFPSDRGDHPAYSQATAALQSALADQHELLDFDATFGVSSATFSPDGRIILARSFNDELRLWNRSGRLIQVFRHVESLLGTSQDASLLLVDSDDQHARLIRTSDRRVLAVFNDDSSVALSPDGERVLSSTPGGYTLWTIDGRQIASLPAPADAPAVFSVGGRLIALSVTGGVEIRDALTGELMRVLRTGSQTPTRLLFSPDGRRLAVGFTQSIQIWDPVTGESSGKAFSTVPDAAILGVSFSKAGDRLFARTMLRESMSAASQGTWLWDLPTGRLLVHRPDLLGASLSADGLYLAAIKDDSFELYRVADGFDREACHTAAPGSDSIDPTFPPNGDAVLLAGETDLQLVAAQDEMDGVSCKSLVGSKLQSHTSRIQAAAFSPDGSQLLTGSADKTVRLWRLARSDVSFNANAIPADAFRQGGYFGALDGQTLGIFSAVTGRAVARLPGLSGHVPLFAVSADGRRVATFDGKAVVMWDAKGARISRFDAPETSISLALSPQGDRLVIVSDKKVELVDASTGIAIAQLPNGAGATDVNFSLDDRRLVTVSDDTGRIWDAQTGRSIGKPLSSPSTMVQVEFSPDGKTVLTVSDDNTATIWSATTGESLFTLRGGAYIHSAKFTPDGRRVVTVGDDVAMWDEATGQRLVSYSYDAGNDPDVFATPDGIVVIDGPHRVIWPARFLYGRDLFAEGCQHLARDFTPEERRAYGVKPVAAYCRRSNLP